jgi:hypothetical protein
LRFSSFGGRQRDKLSLLPLQRLPGHLLGVLMNPRCAAQRSAAHRERQIDECPVFHDTGNAACRPRLNDGGLFGLSDVSDSGASLKLGSALTAVERAVIVFFSAAGACLHLVFG